MKRLIKKSTKLLAPACVVMGLLSPQAAWAVEPLIQNFESTASAVGGLIEPIQPFLAATNSGSTTSIIQYGADNYASSDISGKGSLGVIQQSGSNNRAVQAIEGNNSALLLVQGGSNNSVFQAAKGNSDVQLVGVSGQNNQVAYIQSGDNLAGVLDVRNATNATVVAIQTPQSGQFMMPTGLNGISNATVVVVPGRMYVFPKKN